MRTTLRSAGCVASVLLVAACASAGDRLMDGIELQVEGRYLEAALRYVEALDKDGGLVEARERLTETSDSAVQVGMRAAADLWAEGDPIAAADQFRALDGLAVRMLVVGERLGTPQEYADVRRESFEWAMDALMSNGQAAFADGRFAEARSAFQRARNDYEASAPQRAASLDAETEVLLAWAAESLDAGRFRQAFDRAAEAVEVRPSPGPATLDAAASIQARALERGTVRLAVLPVTSVPIVLDAVGAGFGSRLGDDLELDYWRQPPPFVAVVDPVQVRRQTRDERRGRDVLGPRDIERIMGAVGADFAALIEVASLTSSEEDPEVTARSATTRDGRNTSYEVVTGRLVYRAEVSVILLDRDGDEIDSWTANGQQNGRFQRGEYRADPAELELGRNEARLFDPEVLDAQHADVEDEVIAEIAERVADRVFDRVLSRVR